jgi:oligoendopeptidase F
MDGMPAFIHIAYDDSVVSMSTLVHELGHSMHAYFSDKKQPPCSINRSRYGASFPDSFPGINN